MRTCWLKLPSFSEVAHRLRDRYDGSSKVIARNDGTSFMTEGLSIKPPTKQDLVYTEESPDFCKPNPKIGSLGKLSIFCDFLINNFHHMQVYIIENATLPRVVKIAVRFYAAIMVMSVRRYLSSQIASANSSGVAMSCVMCAQKNARSTHVVDYFVS